VALLIAGGVLVRESAARAQEQVGHKLLGTLGADAGVLIPPGFYVLDQVAFYRANRVADQSGNPLPIPGLDLDALGNAVALSGTIRIPHLGYWTGSVAIPFAHFQASTDDPRARLDEFGFADIYVQPLGLGWGFDRFDVTTSYAFYAPNGQVQPNSLAGIGNGYWTNEFSAGGAVWLDRSRGWRVSAIASYDLNGKKRSVDITRGDTVQVQGGTAMHVLGPLDVGVAAYALWQVTNNTGSDLPAVLKGTHERVVGVGPDVGAFIPQLRVRLDARYEWEFLARSRQAGQIFVFSIGFALWEPHHGHIEPPAEIASTGVGAVDDRARL
jgi:hypothetical protein